MAEIGEPLKRRIVIPETIPGDVPATKPAKVPEKEPA